MLRENNIFDVFYLYIILTLNYGEMFVFLFPEIEEQ